MEATGDKQWIVDDQEHILWVTTGDNFADDFVYAEKDNEFAGRELFEPRNLPRWLAFSGVIAASFAINCGSFPRERLRSDELLPVAYVSARFVLFLSGMGLMALSARANSGAPARHAALARVAMSAALLLLVAVFFLGAFGMN